MVVLRGQDEVCGDRCSCLVGLVVVVEELENSEELVRGKGLAKVQKPCLVEAQVSPRTIPDYRSLLFLSSHSW